MKPQIRPPRFYTTSRHSDDACHMFGLGPLTKPQASSAVLCTLVPLLDGHMAPEEGIISPSSVGQNQGLQRVTCPRSETRKNRRWDIREPDASSPSELFLFLTPLTGGGRSSLHATCQFQCPCAHPSLLQTPQLLPSVTASAVHSHLPSLLSLPACSATPVGAPFLHKEEGLPLSVVYCSEPATGSQSLPHIPGKSILLRQKYHQVVPPLTFFGDFPLPLETISGVCLIGHPHCPPRTSDSRPLHVPLCLRAFAQAPPVNGNTLLYPTLTHPSEFPAGVSPRAHIWADVPNTPGILYQSQAHPELSWSFYSSAPFSL